MKDTTKQGETKSGPAEIKKFARYVCERCGLSGPRGMINGTRCANVAACEKRIRKSKAKK